MKKPDVAASFETMLGHESIHWLGYLHYTGFDLSYIATLCCFDHKDEYMNEVRDKACKLFKYSNDQWATHEYIHDFTLALGSYGYSFIGVKTAGAAAIAVRRNNASDQQVSQILTQAAIAMSDGALDKNTDFVPKFFSSSELIPQTLIYAYAANTQNQDYFQKVEQRYYSAEPEKIIFFKLFARTFSDLIYRRSSRLVKSWSEFTKQAPSMCGKLKAFEIKAIKELASNTHVDLYNLTDESAVTNYDGNKTKMIINWSNICPNSKVK